MNCKDRLVDPTKDNVSETMKFIRSICDSIRMAPYRAIGGSEHEYGLSRFLGHGNQASVVFNSGKAMAVELRHDVFSWNTKHTRPISGGYADCPFIVSLHGPGQSLAVLLDDITKGLHGTEWKIKGSLDEQKDGNQACCHTHWYDEQDNVALVIIQKVGLDRQGRPQA